MKVQLDILHKIRSHLDEEAQNVQDEVLEILQLKIGIVNAKLKGYLDSHSLKIKNSDEDAPASRKPVTISRLKKSKYSLLKDELTKTIEDMERWQSILFNPTWFTLMKLQSLQVGTALLAIEEKGIGNENEIITKALMVRDPLRKSESTHIFLPISKLNSAKIVNIAFSSVRSFQNENESKWRLLDCVRDLSRKKVRDLAITLRSTSPSTFGLLRCLGPVHNEQTGLSYLVFAMPQNARTPETLRAKLLARDTTHSLSDRFGIAIQLARAVCSIHTFEMVHKSIRPENILLFEDQKTTLGSAYLLGFEQVRMEDAPTRLQGDPNWELNVYRHPQRQGQSLKARYIMQHDIYSLGVCLLEIGLWKAFVEYSGPEYPGCGPIKPRYFNFHGSEPDDEVRSILVKNELLSLAKFQLPGKMGTKYSEIVQTCLTCLDNFLEVLMKLSTISV
jgi:hypothetical protein